jgi:hypothetical protein
LGRHTLAGGTGDGLDGERSVGIGVLLGLARVLEGFKVLELGGLGVAVVGVAASAGVDGVEVFGGA